MADFSQVMKRRNGGAWRSAFSWKSSRCRNNLGAEMMGASSLSESCRKTGGEKRGEGMCDQKRCVVPLLLRMASPGCWENSCNLYNRADPTWDTDSHFARALVFARILSISAAFNARTVGPGSGGPAACSGTDR
jgi:hypothetical protein